MEKFEAVATTDMVFMTERLLDLQDIFYAEGKPTQVDIAFHYTRNENLENIRTVSVVGWLLGEAGSS